MGKIYDLIIIGSGPAGLCAGIYAKRACLETILFEDVVTQGGQITQTYEVDNYLGIPGVILQVNLENMQNHLILK